MAIPLLAWTAVAGSVMTSWLSGQLPRRGESPAEIERKLRNIVLATLTSIAIGYLAYEFTKKTEETTKVRKKVFTPGTYYI